MRKKLVHIIALWIENAWHAQSSTWCQYPSLHVNDHTDAGTINVKRAIKLSRIVGHMRTMICTMNCNVDPGVPVKHVLKFEARVKFPTMCQLL
jgi:hypothetical protein